MAKPVKKCIRGVSVEIRQDGTVAVCYKIEQIRTVSRIISEMKSKGLKQGPTFRAGSGIFCLAMAPPAICDVLEHCGLAT